MPLSEKFLILWILKISRVVLKGKNYGKAV